VGLMSPALVALLAVVTTLLLAAILRWWPRLAARGLRPVSLRIAALAALQLSVLSLIFVVVNNSAEFYASWSELFGAQSGGGGVITGRQAGDQGRSEGQAVAPVTVTASSAVATPGPSAVASGELQAVTFHGQLSGLRVPGFVYLPPGYATATAPLPVAVVISGQLNAAGQPYSAGRLAATAARQIAAGKLEPLILVMLPGRIGPDQGCLDVPGGAQAATFVTQDLPEAVAAGYRAQSPATRRWALLADSGGGYCALQLAMTNSETFAAAALPPGDYTAPPGPAEFGGSPAIRTEDNLTWLLRRQPMQPVSVLFTGPGPAQPFLSQARPPMHVGQAGLDAGRWALAGVIDWVGGVLRQPPGSRS
jgi:enterochelin esterase-like enzyme